jgi:3-oxoacyl-(acyl-carrier-protein) synthase/surfactin synthase thioesterase subunit/acyl carrier protein
MTDHLSTLQKALYTIRKLKQSIQNQIIQPIAIIGLGCRFPPNLDKKGYWQLLCRGENVIEPLPQARWTLLQGSDEIKLRDPNHTYWGSFLKDIDAFDPYFFGISPREARLMDPQQRLFMQVAYEAIEDAGIPLEQLANSNTGVFASLYASQFAHLQATDAEIDALYLPTGNATSIAANRLSYWLNIHGPSMVIDTACSSTLVAAHLACLYLQNHLCDLALVGGVQINLLPSINLILSKAKMLSPDGQCKTFDESANGYVPGEGAGVIVLKRLDQAIQNQDRIYAIIAGSTINQDGATNGLTAPNGLQQAALLKTAYKNAKINPGEVGYVECHGTGTFLGDPIEAEALGEVISSERNAESPCWIGSVKTNIGHLEPAAGIASLIKVALALQHTKILPHLNFSTPNPHIAFDDYHFQVAKQTEEWPKYGAHRVAGISGFGFGGTNAHLVLRDLTENEKPIPTLLNSNTPALFTLSAKNPDALKTLIERWCHFLAGNFNLDIAQLCYNLQTRRSHYTERLALLVNSTPKLYHLLCILRKNPTEILPNIFTTLQKITEKSATNNASDPIYELANAYIHHQPIDWQKITENKSYPMIDFPLYPWQTKVYWPKIRNPTITETSIYPLKGKQIHSPLPSIQFSFVFNTKNLPEIRDTFHILHAGYYLEMLAFATHALYQKNDFMAQAIDFLSPIIVPDEASINVQLVIEKITHDIYSFTFYSQTSEEHDWTKHATGQWIPTVTHEKKTHTIQSIQERCVTQDHAEFFYQKIKKMGMPTGESIRWTTQYWLGEKEILCKFLPPHLANANEKFLLKIHPGIIDACIQAQFMLLPEQFSKPFVASHIDQLHYSTASHTEFYLWASLNEIPTANEKMKSCWTLMDSTGKTIAHCENLHMTEIDNRVPLETLERLSQSKKFTYTSSQVEKRLEQIVHYLTEQLALILAMPKEDIDPNQPLKAMGIDSLMALLLIQIIGTEFRINYTLPTIFESASITAIAEDILTKHKTNSIVSSNEENLENKPNPWIFYRQTQSAAKLRLFCFPYGGGGASIYQDWQAQLPKTIEVCPIQLPGRENRMYETPLHELDTLIKLLVTNLQPELNIPFAFFGHSFGALIAFAFARQLRHLGLSLPTHLFASAYPDPKTSPSTSLNRLLAQMQSANLDLLSLGNDTAIKKLREDEINTLFNIFNENGVITYNHQAMSKNIIELLLPIFVGDMRIVKSYQHLEEAPFDFPITVFTGRQDTWVPHEDCLEWAAYTRKEFAIHTFNSGHLFVKEDVCRDEMLRIIATSFDTRLRVLDVV